MQNNTTHCTAVNSYVSNASHRIPGRVVVAHFARNVQKDATCTAQHTKFHISSTFMNAFTRVTYKREYST